MTKSDTVSESCAKVEQAVQKVNSLKQVECNICRRKLVEQLKLVSGVKRNLKELIELISG